jgi:selenocysteine lyase/cysteine desulfurase
VTFIKQAEDCETLQRRLRASNINISVSGLSSTRFDMQARNLQQVCRASVHYYNTSAEIERFCAALSSSRGGQVRVLSEPPVSTAMKADLAEALNADREDRF